MRPPIKRHRVKHECAIFSSPFDLPIFSHDRRILGDPKMAVFVTILLPQFTPETDASFLTLLLLGPIFCKMTSGRLTGYAAAVARPATCPVVRQIAGLSTLCSVPSSSPSACAWRPNTASGTEERPPGWIEIRRGLDRTHRMAEPLQSR